MLDDEDAAEDEIRTLAEELADEAQESKEQSDARERDNQRTSDADYLNFLAKDAATTRVVQQAEGIAEAAGWTVASS